MSMAPCAYKTAARSSRDRVAAARLNGLSNASAAIACPWLQSLDAWSVSSRALSRRANKRPPMEKPSEPASLSRTACRNHSEKDSRLTVRDWPSTMCSSRVVPMSTPSCYQASAQSSRHSTL